MDATVETPRKARKKNSKRRLAGTKWEKNWGTAMGKNPTFAGAQSEMGR